MVYQYNFVDGIILLEKGFCEYVIRTTDGKIERIKYADILNELSEKIVALESEGKNES